MTLAAAAEFILVMNRKKQQCEPAQKQIAYNWRAC